MAVFTCKMCGGALNITSGSTVVTCEYCGTQQTLPRLDDERRANLYDRANHFRRNNEYDKAMNVYEQILTEDNTDAEAYWSLVLCRYGIEYVEDTFTRKRIPTVNRTQFTSVFDDDNYKSALKYADAKQRAVYEKEAQEINEIQKGILSVSQKEKPFDVFICYKETDNNGRRTLDSVLANDLYHQLVQEGFKVFFSRITLEDKLGSAYEPYIFAALNSAKVMVVLGTKPEYFNAVWVRNEWSRFLSLIKQGQNKMLIPAYRDMNPYDLPEEFSHLQAQDMSKLGFMQDLIRGIRKIVLTDPNKTTIVQENFNVNVDTLLKRVFIFLEDEDWKSADEYCEKVLDMDPENAKAYLGKLMAELHVSLQENLKDCETPFDNSNNYQKAIRYADDDLKNTLFGYIKHINIYNENVHLDNAYRHAKTLMSNSCSQISFIEAAKEFELIRGYLDSAELEEQCYENAEIARKDSIYNLGMEKMKADSVYCYKIAIEFFEKIPGWKDSDELLSKCRERIETIQSIAKRRRKIISFAVFTAVVIYIVVSLYRNYFIPYRKYNAAIKAINSGNYIEAYESLVDLGDYKDSSKRAEKIYEKYKTETLKKAEIGDSIFIGKYEQDGVDSTYDEDIEWEVIDKQEGRILVVSKYVLDCKQYHSPNLDVTWENSDIRKFLNDVFIEKAFNEKELAMIPTVNVPADKNPEFDSNPGNATQDKIFLLSISEVEKYFTVDSDRLCKATNYACANGVYVNNENGYCFWSLRTPGEYQRYVSRVDSLGYVYHRGNPVSSSRNGIRPAMWIEIDK